MLKIRWGLAGLLVMFTLMQWVSSMTVFAEGTTADTNSTTTWSQIEAFIQEKMKEGNIPGVAVSVVQGDQVVYEKGVGYADVEKQLPVGPETLFELGSTSKAFTALGILKLQEKGLVNLQDPVTKYLPWLTLQYKGKPVEVTLEQFYHHTSGVPFRTIADIPIASGDDALEQTARTLINEELDSLPGDRYNYATINYDVLGLVIAKVSGQSYEAFMRDEVLQPLHMNQTYLSRAEASQHGLAQGYKYEFLEPRPYDAPEYRGNVPAGYLISNAEDMATWLQTQLVLSTNGSSSALIRESHQPNLNVLPSIDGSYYAGGWFVKQHGGVKIFHDGGNPNFSSYIVLLPQEKWGVAVLANSNSAYTQTIAEGVLDLARGKQPAEDTTQEFIFNRVDQLSVILLSIMTPLFLLTCGMIVKKLIELIRKQRRFSGKPFMTAVQFGFFGVFLFGFYYVLNSVPNVFFNGMSWNFVEVWGPQSLLIGLSSTFIAVFALCIHFLLSAIFIKPDEKSFFSLVILSVASGLGNALIIFVINESFHYSNGYEAGLLAYFALGIAIYIIGQRLVRVKLIQLTNNEVYSKRLTMINKILNTSYQRFEEIENEKIYAGLNNDTELISNFANVLVTGLTNSVTLICCFVYLGMVNFYGMLTSVVVIALAAGLYTLVGQASKKIWEDTRNLQNTFFRLITAIVKGYKELNLHSGKRQDFRNDIYTCCEEYRDKRIEGDTKFANVFVIGELLFTIVIGIVAFIFPLIFSDIRTDVLRNYIFVFLYMTGPVHGIMNTVPTLIQMRISWERINGLIKQITLMESTRTGAKPVGHVETLEMKDVKFRYRSQNGETFSVGPINLTLRGGEITFITGGNGSGKSTLAKLMTGLYEADSGEIYINGETISRETLSQHYSAIFTDFHLFEKMYGIDYVKKQERISHYLKELQLDDKIEIVDGKFSTTQLSTGQRKRLALLVTYLEDRPILLFDEWAADQDASYREFFYMEILPQLRDENRCVIVISHDDRYFHTADRLIKVDLGRIVQNDDQRIARENVMTLSQA
ncbi:cyclic peptide export ABC transporter [Brevibacillus antibioticus]|uniref:cyclic peptide export ABC transporter n=1 Tax=Brevibacillus antibioticus TaxID=2570228 RepID=UPI0013902044|nr:cyclic peptide export ABC transporter [Brevibacillus antibioticus]